MRAATRLVVVIAVSCAGLATAGCECGAASHTLPDGGDGGMDAAVAPGRDAGEGGLDAALHDGGSPPMDAAVISLDGRAPCGPTTEMNADSCPADQPMCCACFVDLETDYSLCFPGTILEQLDCPRPGWCGAPCNIRGCWESAPEGSEYACGGDAGVAGGWVDWRLCPSDRPHCCLARGGFVCADHALYGRWCSSPPDP